MSHNFADPLRNNNLTLLVDILLFDVRLMAKLHNGVGREAQHTPLNAGIFDLAIPQTH